MIFIAWPWNYFSAVMDWQVANLLARWGVRNPSSECPNKRTKGLILWWRQATSPQAPTSKGVSRNDDTSSSLSFGVPGSFLMRWSRCYHLPTTQRMELILSQRFSVLCSAECLACRRAQSGICWILSSPFSSFSYFTRLVNSASGASACLTQIVVMSEMIDG